MMIATIAVAIGLALGAFIPSIAAYFLQGALPIEIDTKIPAGSLALAAVYGYLMALVFALWPLSRARDIPPTSLFRDREGTSKLEIVGDKQQGHVAFFLKFEEKV